MSFFHRPRYFLDAQWYSPAALAQAMVDYQPFCQCDVESAEGGSYLTVMIHPDHAEHHDAITGEFLNYALGLTAQGNR
jgi:hypothetical protein